MLPGHEPANFKATSRYAIGVDHCGEFVVTNGLKFSYKTVVTAFR